MNTILVWVTSKITKGTKWTLVYFCVASVFVLPALAQTEFNIESQSSNIEQEYREELDKWMLRAYEGDRDAQFKVGVLFTNTQFNQPDFEQAVYWYKQAARQGHVLAQYNIGHQYLTGTGVKQNERTAMDWWLKAADQDHALAQFNIGRAYYLGIGLPEDHEQSRYWFSRAADNQEPKSIEILQQLGWSVDTGKPPANENQDVAVINPVSNELLPDESAASTDDAFVPEGSSEISSNAAGSSTANDSSNDEGDISVEDSEPTESSPPASSNSATGSASQTTPLPSQDTQPVLVSRIVPADNQESAETPAAPEPIIVSPVNTPNEVEKRDPPIANASTQRESIPEPKATISTALYTDPKIRSVLIAIVDDRSKLIVMKRAKDWLTVTSSVGFPVWVHRDYISINGNRGSISGNSVNARSVPIITDGTIVGRLEKGEKVRILDKRKQWYRIVAPTRFQAWVKAEDFAQTQVSQATQKPAPQEQSKPITQNNPAGNNMQRGKTTGGRVLNDNLWLYSQPSEGFTLQLASFDEAEKIDLFLSSAKFSSNADLHQFTARGKDIQWTYFLYGSYADKDSAESAKQDIKQRRAWIRTFGVLQQNRCVAWKKQVPAPSELNKYCG